MVLNESFHCELQSAKRLRSFKRTESFGEQIVMIHLVSSANRRGVDEWMEFGRSFIKMTNKRGPRMLPWGTPDVTGNMDE